MDAISAMEAWDRSLRDGDWDRARSLLADDATHLGSEDLEADVELVEWETVGGWVIARLRQPAWGENADWYQMLSVEDDLIIRLEDFPTSDSAFAAVG